MDRMNAAGVAVDADTTTDDRPSPGEQDTCRICRGEGSNSEPLFYPCKCSGSIKFVHQDCLMEWLSHSQKQHCELCKTPFRFTKLYHPLMPSALPKGIFLRHLGMHIARNMLSWFRLVLVTFVWLILLPRAMRAVWRCLFWVADGGWASWDTMAPTSTTFSRLSIPSTAGSTSSKANTPHTALPYLRVPVSKTLNMTDNAPHTIGLLQQFAEGLISWTNSQPLLKLNGTTLGEQLPMVTQGRRRVSFLSDVMFLKQLTNSPTINNLVIDVLEGQLITLMVVVAFILVFLIREWVVQQRPEMQMGGEFEADFAAAPLEENPLDEDERDARADAFNDNATNEIEIVPGQPESSALNITSSSERDLPESEGSPAASSSHGPELERILEDPSELEQHQRRLHAADGPGGHDVTEDRYHDPELSDGIAQLLARTALRRQRSASSGVEPTVLAESGSTDEDSFNQSRPSSRGVLPSESDERPNMDDFGDADVSRPEPQNNTHTHRPSLPDRGALSRAAIIRRAIEESGSSVTDRFGGRVWPIEVFMDLWLRANRDPDEVLRIIEAENQTDELNWIVEVMRRRSADRESSDTLSTHCEIAFSTPETIARMMDTDNPAFDAGSGESHLHERIMMPESDRESVGSQLPRRSAEESPLVPPRDEQPEGKRRPSHHGSTEDELRLYSPSSQESPWTEQDRHERVGDLNSLRRSDDNETLTPSSSAVDQSLLGNDPVDHLDTEGAEQGDSQAAMVAVGAHAPPNGLADRRGLTGRVMHWLWGDMPQPQPQDAVHHEDDEHIVQDLEAELPFHPRFALAPPEDQDLLRPPHAAFGLFEPRDLLERPILAAVDHVEEFGEVEGAGNPIMEAIGDNPGDAVDPDVDQPPGEDLNDADAIEEGEDFDGMMELIGMHGPLMGLFQNVCFSAVLISATVAGAIWFPYIWGKIVLLVVAHPLSLFVRFPLRCSSVIANICVDLSLFFAGSFVYWTDQILRALMKPFVHTIPGLAGFTQATTVANLSRSIAERGLDRIAKLIVATSTRVSEADYPTLSIICHQSLQEIKTFLAQRVVETPQYAISVTRLMLNSLAPSSIRTACTLLVADLFHLTVADIKKNGARFVVELVATINSIVWTRSNEVQDRPDITQAMASLDVDLAHWGFGDRICAILAGYSFFSLIGALYLRRGRFLSTSEDGQKLERLLLDALRQAGGVLKVILIISIEMIAFPLYCGLLLDLALLPLFEQASAASRIQFTVCSPWTSAFVHWFIGTCYMFHFALFVSMCRRIMRKGVLYFIRDPDDPTFHPVRDVLERNVVTQLRKITFSALVYGGLVIVCLGGVVWGLDYIFVGVLPIHWSSNEPVLEFPVDLLFYNFLAPLAVRFFRPSDGLHEMYTWWFRQCARSLRLSSFLFGDRREDEEGRHVRRSWLDVVHGKQGDPTKPVIGADRRTLAEDRSIEAYFLRDGRYVRSPGSDQVRIPKGHPVFVEVDENGIFLDQGLVDAHGQQSRSSNLFATVYIPPMFRGRIALFILLIWIFAALTGVGITIVPLVVGRRVFATVFPGHVRMNDIYAFSIGFNLLGGLLHLAAHRGRVMVGLRHALDVGSETRKEFVTRAYQVATRAARLTYTYAAFGLLLPSLFALLMEFYVIIPLHTVMASEQRHMIHFVQDWTVGVLYVKLVGRLILWHSHSRPAEALRAVVRQGWTDPDVRIATRCFILPACVAMIGALLAPLPLGWMANTIWYHQASETMQTKVYRYSYPAVLATAMGSLVMFTLGVMFERWQRMVKDEVYLIGERLHNYGEQKGNAAARRLRSS